ncbi:tetratricopeptide repeat protein [Nocardia sp. NBC_00565]|uniref:tetratricopeptide repeat protein n=1 Tax=Nocardia sp. NBC_00565 TaxID=2975993 RepID=UPI002E805E42|nr:tetratricopeptide repeat protein [Nocardia sp. NBC_00565]WUB99989.1 tetratricopeptide repeat protein [Nocardia sp. NBC_00565]
MSGRVALVIGSECAALPRLGFTGELATGLYTELRELGGWQPATRAGGPLLDPNIDELVRAVDDAFEIASNQQATLLISFIGHGLTTASENFYLLAHDSPRRPMLRTAFHLTQEIQERLNSAAALDGLIVLVDACETGEGVRGAARRWPEASGPNGRVELLVATGNGPAYFGCFTRTIITTFGKGVPRGGESLLPSDLVRPLRQCPALEPQSFSFTSGIRTASSDPGLWLVPNVARREDAVSGSAAAGFIDQLINGLVVSEPLRERLTQVVDAGEDRLRGVVGPAGCGKSTLLATLIRPSWVDTLPIKAEYITAAVILDVTSSLESFTAELAQQLGRRLDGFKTATRMVEFDLAEQDSSRLDQFDIKILRPLARLDRSKPMHILVDGLDHPKRGSRTLLSYAIAELTRRPELAHVRLIVGIREGTGIENSPLLIHMRRIEVPAPTTPDIANTVAAARGHTEHSNWREWIDGLLQQTPTGGWLLARLLIEIRSDITSADLDRGIDLDTLVWRRVRDVVDNVDPATARAVSALLGILVAAGAGPVLPLELLERALDFLGIGLSTNRIRDLVVRLGVLVSRGRPGTSGETLGLAHNAFRRCLVAEGRTVARREAHRALAKALEQDARSTEPVPQITDYARRSAVRHYLGYRDSTAALAFLERLNTPRAADNRDLWAAWIPALEASVGSEHPDTLTARNNLAFWRGESGDLATATVDHQNLLAQSTRVLGADAAGTLTIRTNLARWHGESGDFPTAVAEFEQLVADRTRLLGADDPATLRTRGDLAHFRGEQGETAEAIAGFQRLFADRLRVLGPDHPDTLTARYELAYWRSESGDIDTAIIELHQLLVDQQRISGTADPAFFKTRHRVTQLHAESGDHVRAISEFEQLLAQQERVLGPDHPHTLITRNDVARWRGVSGDHATAIAEFQQLLTDRTRILGPEHPRTLRTRNNIAYWRGESGDHRTAIEEFGALIEDERRILGLDHPITLLSRHNLAHLYGEIGHYRTAVAEFEQILPVRIRILGPDHPHTLRTRHELAFWRGESGNPATAVHEYQRLLADRQRVLPIDHPDTLRTRHAVAYWRGESGDPATAVAEYEHLLRDELAVLGPHHPETFSTRHSLAFFRGQRGQVGAAVIEYEQLLDDERAILGPDHPETLHTWHRLALARGEIGDTTAALAALEELLPIRLRVLGPEHPDTLRTRHNLARWRGEAGQYVTAIAEYEAVLADRRRILGPDHHDTLTTLHNLAFWRGESDDPATAVIEFEQLLVVRERMLGPDHPDTLRTRANLAHYRAQGGDIATALEEFEYVLANRIRVHGPEHPNTFRTRHDLACWRGAQGDPTIAVTELDLLLIDRVRVLGDDHPDTLLNRDELARWRCESGDPRTAVHDLERLLADEHRIFGVDHPRAFATRYHLAHARRCVGDTATATVEYERLLEEQLRVLGPDHPDTRRTRAACHNGIPRSMGRFDVLARIRRALGRTNGDPDSHWPHH